MLAVFLSLASCLLKWTTNQKLDGKTLTGKGSYASVPSGKITLEIYHCSFSKYGQKQNYLGLIYVNSKGAITNLIVQFSTFTDNFVRISGSCFSIRGTKSVDISHCTFKGNYLNEYSGATSIGGAIMFYPNCAGISMKHNIFENNPGGGIYFQTSVSVNDITNCTFSGDALYPGIIADSGIAVFSSNFINYGSIGIKSSKMVTITLNSCCFANTDASIKHVSGSSITLNSDKSNHFSGTSSNLLIGSSSSVDASCFVSDLTCPYVDKPAVPTQSLARPQTPEATETPSQSPKPTQSPEPTPIIKCEIPFTAGEEFNRNNENFDGSTCTSYFILIDQAIPSIKINNCSFSNFQKITTNSDGGCIIIAATVSSVEIVGAKFENCLSYNKGSAIYCEKTSTIKLSQCTFKACSTKYISTATGPTINGGAVYLSTGFTKISIETCNFTECPSGGIYIDSGNTIERIFDCHFNQNALTNNGAISGIYSGSGLVLEQCTFNDCSGYYGPINVDAGDLTLKRCEVVKCSCVKNNIIYIKTGIDVSISQSYFCDWFTTTTSMAIIYLNNIKSAIFSETSFVGRDRNAISYAKATVEVKYIKCCFSMVDGYTVTGSFKSPSSYYLKTTGSASNVNLISIDADTKFLVKTGDATSKYVSSAIKNNKGQFVTELECLPYQEPVVFVASSELNEIIESSLVQEKIESSLVQEKVESSLVQEIIESSFQEKVESSLINDEEIKESSLLEEIIQDSSNKQEEHPVEKDSSLANDEHVESSEHVPQDIKESSIENNDEHGSSIKENHEDEHQSSIKDKENDQISSYVLNDEHTSFVDHENPTSFKDARTSHLINDKHTSEEHIPETNTIIMNIQTSNNMNQEIKESSQNQDEHETQQQHDKDQTSNLIIKQISSQEDDKKENIMSSILNNDEHNKQASSIEETTTHQHVVDKQSSAAQNQPDEQTTKPDHHVPVNPTTSIDNKPGEQTTMNHKNPTTNIDNKPGEQTTMNHKNPTTSNNEHSTKQALDFNASSIELIVSKIVNNNEDKLVNKDLEGGQIAGIVVGVLVVVIIVIVLALFLILRKDSGNQSDGVEYETETNESIDSIASTEAIAASTVEMDQDEIFEVESSDFYE